MPIGRLTAAFVGLATAATIAVPPAGAQETPPPDPAIGQYVETVPTSSGAKVRTGTNKATKKPSDAVRKAVAAKGGSDATALEEVVSSADLGAPETGAQELPKQRGAPTAKTERAKPEASSATPAAVNEGGSSQLVWLGGALALLTAGALVVAVVRARGPRA